jgi:hypothetical protein
MTETYQQVAREQMEVESQHEVSRNSRIFRANIEAGVNEVARIFQSIRLGVKHAWSLEQNLEYLRGGKFMYMALIKLFMM